MGHHRQGLRDRHRIDGASSTGTARLPSDGCVDSHLNRSHPNARARDGRWMDGSGRSVRPGWCHARRRVRVAGADGGPHGEPPPRITMPRQPQRHKRRDLRGDDHP
eukprot:2995907-Pyramimonas_sp.AAC.1